ncbi:MAG: ferrochelatase [Methyloversatilis sp. 12-65-5]|nr:MAG: ferrochelatase [Methyloversatilis sp. 12-65-5]
MSRFNAEPSYTHGQPARTGVLLVNLGTPDKPDAPSLRRYLKQFLSDDRVVEIPKVVWWFILNVIILNVRPKQSAEKYASVWTDEGSPLRVHTERQAKLLRGWMIAEGRPDMDVRFAMRYGNPAIGDVLQQMKMDGCTRILMLPMYPQAASSTTGSMIDELAQTLLRWRNLPELRYLRAFAADAGYIGALAASVREHWAKNPRSSARDLYAFSTTSFATLVSKGPLREPVLPLPPPSAILRVCAKVSRYACWGSLEPVRVRFSK